MDCLMTDGHLNLVGRCHHQFKGKRKKSSFPPSTFQVGARYLPQLVYRALCLPELPKPVTFPPSLVPTAVSADVAIRAGMWRTPMLSRMCILKPRHEVIPISFSLLPVTLAAVFGESGGGEAAASCAAVEVRHGARAARTVPLLVARGPTDTRRGSVSVEHMDPLSVLAVRFHFNGEFMRSSSHELQYIGGSEAMSYIDRDKISFPEILGHLRDHFSVQDSVVLHWLFPGRELGDGLRALWDDLSCLKMAECVVDVGVADIYVELRGAQEGRGEASDFEAEMKNMSDSVSEDSREEPAIKKRKTVTGSRKGKEVVKVSARKGKAHEDENEAVDVDNENNMDDVDDGSSSDSDYMPGDDCSSEDDDEAAEILKKFMDFKKKLRRGEAARLDDIYLGPASAMPAGFDGIEDDGDETEYFDTDDEESYDDIGSDGEIRRKANAYPRYKKTKNIPKFSLGMKFSCKSDFKKAIIKYAMAERKVINFKKDDPKRMRAKCDWPTCPRVCLLSDNSRNEGWQIVTFHELHTCPPRRDTKHVTAKRIAERYEKFIMANPSWNLTANSQQSVTISGKRKSAATPGLGKKVLKSTTAATVRTEHGGSATLKVVASLQGSQSNSTVRIKNSGTASAQVASTSSPSKKLPAKRPSGPILLPWETAQL